MHGNKRPPYLVPDLSRKGLKFLISTIFKRENKIKI